VTATPTLKYRIGYRLKFARYWVEAQATFLALNILRLLPPKRATAFADWVARRLGRIMGRNRVALANLQRALPDHSSDEHKQIAEDMWANMARLTAEYIFLDQLIKIDLDNPAAGTVEVEGIDIFMRIQGESARPRIFFTGHLGNFELLPIGAAAYGLDVTALFRPPNNPYVAARILQARRTTMGHLVPSKAGAAWALANILDNNGNVGVLVDQHFHKGVAGTFFGRPCMTSPLLAKLARQYDCDVYPVVCTRLPDNRFRVQLFDKLDVPHSEDGMVDVQSLTQLINDTVEGWIRKDPGQWMWFHKRWKGESMALAKRPELARDPTE
jgi:KDO2-lipid IV(A) lauroyltransferase